MHPHGRVMCPSAVIVSSPSVSTMDDRQNKRPADHFLMTRVLMFQILSVTFSVEFSSLQCTMIDVDNAFLFSRFPPNRKFLRILENQNLRYLRIIFKLYDYPPHPCDENDSKGVKHELGEPHCEDAPYGLPIFQKKILDIRKNVKLDIFVCIVASEAENVYRPITQSAQSAHSWQRGQINQNLGKEGEAKKPQIKFAGTKPVGGECMLKVQFEILKISNIPQPKRNGG